ncbi:hypothetical protein ISF6_1101 [Piscinibacter sakaiensis]|uniref:Uncharacterized protein n=1 Tax=Piscinibacter sakaiensis TaxID=1547922 RepID=A0A0K8NTV0_PISS1|nr:hypothetical protein ISF6_1101 [Piscinibacter sakaiensis]
MSGGPARPQAAAPRVDAHSVTPPPAGPRRGIASPPRPA